MPFFVAPALLFASTLIADPMTDNRNAYNKCLKTYSNEQLEAATPAKDFGKGVRETCLDQRNAMMAAIVKDEMSYGGKKDEAERYATEEADGVVAAYTGSYPDYLSGNIRFGD